jgi:purine-binding chemotaxis protein CheW
MEDLSKYVVFRIEEQQFSIHLSVVDRIIPILEIHPLPMAPEYIMGTINYHGVFLPVVNMRKLFSLPQRELELSDQLIIATISHCKVVLWVDSVREIFELSAEDITNPEKILLDLAHIQGLFKLRDGMVLIHDLEKVLTHEQVARIISALAIQKE